MLGYISVGKVKHVILVKVSFCWFRSCGLSLASLPTGEKLSPLELIVSLVFQVPFLVPFVKEPNQLKVKELETFPKMEGRNSRVGSASHATPRLQQIWVTLNNPAT